MAYLRLLPFGFCYLFNHFQPHHSFANNFSVYLLLLISFLCYLLNFRRSAIFHFNLRIRRRSEWNWRRRKRITMAIKEKKLCKIESQIEHRKWCQKVCFFFLFCISSHRLLCEYKAFYLVATLLFSFTLGTHTTETNVRRLISYSIIFA